MYMKNQRGFTLIETLVSLALFSIVVVTATGVILSIITASKRNQAISSVVNNLNYSVDSMIRDISTGYRYRCNYPDGGTSLLLANIKLSTASCGTPGEDKTNLTLISTITGNEQVVRYEFINGTDGVGYIQKTIYKEDGTNVIPIKYPLTDVGNIDIDKFSFSVSVPPALIADGVPGQPSVFVIIKGTARVNQINISDFFIQTFVSQRLPNFI